MSIRHISSKIHVSIYKTSQEFHDNNVDMYILRLRNYPVEIFVNNNNNNNNNNNDNNNARPRTFIRRDCYEYIKNQAWNGTKELKQLIQGKPF